MLKAVRFLVVALLVQIEFAPLANADQSCAVLEANAKWGQGFARWIFATHSGEFSAETKVRSFSTSLDVHATVALRKGLKKIASNIDFHGLSVSSPQARRILDLAESEAIRVVHGGVANPTTRELLQREFGEAHVRNWLSIVELQVAARNYAPITQVLRTTAGKLGKSRDFQLKELDSLWVEYRVSELENMIFEEVSSDAPRYVEGVRSATEVNQLAPVVEIIGLPHRKGARSGNTNAFRHPDLPEKIKELENMGVKLVVDTSMSSTGLGAYFWSSTNVVALRPNSTWASFVHEFQHARFNHFVRYRFHELVGRVGNGERFIDLMPREYVDAVKPSELRMLEKLLRLELPEVAINETLSVREENNTFGWAVFNPASLKMAQGASSHTYRLRHVINELSKLRSKSSLTKEQERTLQRAMWMNRFYSTLQFVPPLVWGTGVPASAILIAKAVGLGLLESGDQLEGEVPKFVVARADGQYVFVWAGELRD